jgi:hypothetical protein
VGLAAPWPEFAKTRFWAPFDERKTRGGSAEHGKLSSREIRDEDGPKAVHGSGWRAARFASRERAL